MANALGHKRAIVACGDTTRAFGGSATEALAGDISAATAGHGYQV